MKEAVKNYDAERSNKQKIEDYLNKKNGLWSFVSEIARLKAKKRNEIEDIISESLFQIWKKAETCRYPVDLNNKGFKTWVAVITENKANLAGRKIGRFKDKHILDSDYCYEENFSLEELAETYETPVSLIISTEEKEVIETALRKLISNLSYKLRSVIEICYYEDKNSEEVGEELGLHATTVRTRLYRARKILKKRLKSIRQYYSIVKN